MARLAIVVAALVATPACGPAPELVDAEQPQSKIVGRLNPEFVDEASGLAISRAFPGRLYHHNDSGGGSYFYLTERDGSETQKVRIRGYDDSGQDLEDMSLGPCGNRPEACLYLANIGDNFLRRKSISVVIIEEREHYGGEVDPIRQVRMKYPDGRHNAEGLAIHPSGDLYLLTKGKDNVHFTDRSAWLYRLSKELLWGESDDVRTLESIAEVDFPALSEHHRDDLADVATGFDISPDGKRFLALMMRHAYEFSLADLSDYRMLQIPYLYGQEAVAYLPDGSGFLYTQEFKAARESQIIEVTLGQ